jgi:hypothetical protein
VWRSAPEAPRYELSIEVLDEHRNPLFRTVLSYEVQLLG